MENSPVFEWDEAKRLSNLAKHRIDFRTVITAFADEDAVLVLNGRDDGEERFAKLVRLHDLIVFIVYTVRGERVRLISARVANRKERSRYGQI